jgi:hypothetical protein
MKEGPLETAGKFLCFLRKETLPPPVLQGGYRAKKIMSKFFLIKILNSNLNLQNPFFSKYRLS